MTDHNPIKLSVIVPVYNEKHTVEAIIEKVRKVNIPKEIIVVDNCSTDGTQEILKKLEGIDKTIFQTKNMGKGHSLRTAFPQIRGEYMLIQDGDLEYDPNDFYAILEKAEKLSADAVYGSRVLQGIRTRYITYYWGAASLTLLTNLLYGSRLTDIATTYKLVRTSVLAKLKFDCDGFDFDFELTTKLLRAGVEIQEVPIWYNPRTFAEGKKVRPIDWFKNVRVIFRDRFARIEVNGKV